MDAKRIINSVLVVLSIFSAIFIGNTSQALAFDGRPKKKIDRPPALISEKTSQYLTKVHSYISSESYNNALDMLKKLEQLTISKKQEYAQVMQTYGYLYAQKNELKNAEVYFQKAIDAEALAERETLSTMFLLAQVQMGNENYKGAVETLLDWFSYVEEPLPQAYILLAGGYAELKDYDNAIKAAEIGISKDTDPKEQWYKFLIGMYFTKEAYEKAVPVLKLLVEKYPQQPKYWSQLSIVYYSMDKPKEALVVLELAHKMGHIKEEKDIMNLVHLYMGQDLPYKAATLLEKSLENNTVKSTEKTLQILANAWQVSQELEKAAVSMGKAAAFNKSADLFAQQGNIYLQMRNWKDAVKSLREGVKLGGLKHAGRVYIALGMAEINVGDIKGAKKSFKMAENFETTKSQAEKWIKYIEVEKENTSSM